MKRALPPTPYGTEWQEWALQLVEYLTDRGRDSAVEPSVVQLQHQVQPVVDRATVEGILMYDPVLQTPVFSRDKMWVELVNTLSTTFMRWRGYWPDQGFDYNKNDVVRDGPWTMIANKTTTTKPGPTPLRQPEYDIPVVPAWTTDNVTGQAYTGHKYTLLESGRVTGLQVWLPAVDPDISYRILVVNNDDPANPVIKQLFMVTEIANQWNMVDIDEGFFIPGASLSVILEAVNSSTDTVISSTWDRGDNSQGAEPVAREWNSNNQDTVVRFNYLDNGDVNRSVALRQILAGSTLHIASVANSSQYLTYLIDTVTDTGTSVVYDVTLTDTGPAGEVPIGANSDCEFTVHVPAPTDYVEVTNHWPQPVSWASIEGVKRLDGVDIPAPLSAFGVRLEFEVYGASPDWDFVVLDGPEQADPR